MALDQPLNTLGALSRPFVRPYLSARAAATFASTLLLTAVSWQLYDRTRDAWSLGLMGICTLIPWVGLTVPAGHLADRFARRDLSMVANLLLAAAAAGLFTTSHLQARVALVYALLLGFGAARVLGGTPMTAILPQLVSAEQLLKTTAWLVLSQQVAAMLGPLCAGFLIRVRGDATLAYGVATLAFFFAVLCFRGLPRIPQPQTAARRGWSELLAGFSFIYKTPVLFFSLALEVIAVVLGGCVALLPMFAEDILKVGPIGLGWLRAAPASGSLVMALFMTRVPPWRRPGQVFLCSLAGFGLATALFGVSKLLGLSLFCLFVTGALQQVASLVRINLSQLVTPDGLRGRVNAVILFCNNAGFELGRVESSLAAVFFDPVASVVLGGLGTLAAVGAIAHFSPQLRQLAPLHTLKPAAGAP